MASVTELGAIKDAARTAAFVRRKTAHAIGQGDAAQRLAETLAPHAGKTLASYMPMRTEINPLAAMEAHAATGKVCVPVIVGAGQPLEFHQWTPGCRMVKGTFGAYIPENATVLVPEIVVVPLVAFDRAGNRLGYGGGFYDRTLQGLRARGPVLALGFAYAAQQARDLPIEPTDQSLDAVITEKEVLWFDKG